jgi:hypothetical protein
MISPFVARNLLNQQFPSARGSHAAPDIQSALDMQQANAHYDAEYLAIINSQSDDAPLALPQPPFANSNHYRLNHPNMQPDTDCPFCWRYAGLTEFDLPCTCPAGACQPHDSEAIANP